MLGLMDAGWKRDTLYQFCTMGARETAASCSKVTSTQIDLDHVDVSARVGRACQSLNLSRRRIHMVHGVRPRIRLSLN